MTPRASSGTPVQEGWLPRLVNRYDFFDLTPHKFVARVPWLRARFIRALAPISAEPLTAASILLRPLATLTRREKPASHQTPRQYGSRFSPSCDRFVTYKSIFGAELAFRGLNQYGIGSLADDARLICRASIHVSYRRLPRRRPYRPDRAREDDRMEAVCPPCDALPRSRFRETGLIA